MKKSLTILFCVITIWVYGNNADTVRVIKLQHSVDSLRNTMSILQSQCQDMELVYMMVEQQKQDIVNLRDSNHLQQDEIEGLRHFVSELQDVLQDQDSCMNVFVQHTDALFRKKSMQMGTLKVIVLLTIMIVAVTLFYVWRKVKTGNEQLKNLYISQERMQTMQEDNISLIHSFSLWIEDQTNRPASSEDHTLAMKVADELVRMDANLFHMDSSVKGYKQIVKAIERIKANFQANGYDIVEMLGKPYKDGMKVIANFVTDETLAEGEQIITSIIKPQINYNGKMIQSAQIIVSQNL